MTNYIQKKAQNHKVTHEFSGRRHFFKVETEKGNEHSVSIEVGCDCRYMGVQGIANNKICSHVLAVFQNIIDNGNINLSTGSEQMKRAKRNACLNLVKRSNRKINEIRISQGEGQKHINKKIEVCKKLLSEGKCYVCEAIFDKGGRADVLCLDDFTAIEIVNTESNDSIIRKINEYPDGIKVEVVRC